jgi:protein MpaA
MWCPPAGEVRTLVVAGIHGEEPETTVVLSRALRALAVPLKRCAVVLAANPDGLLRGTRGNARGVDLNRNFPASNWQAGAVTHRWVIEEPSEVQLGTGRAPGSEPETAALLEVIHRFAPARIVALHAPLACIDAPLDVPEAQWLAEKTQLPLQDGVGYPTPGSLGSWGEERGLPILTYEFPKKSVETLITEHVPALLPILSGEWPFD